MKRLALPFAALLLTLTGQTARAQVGVRPNQPLAPPAFSPFLNLARPGVNPAISYFGTVRPQIQTQNELQQLQQVAVAQTYLDNTALLTQPIVNTGTGARFLTQNRYFLTTGRGATTTTAGTALPQQQPLNFGFVAR